MLFNIMLEVLANATTQEEITKDTVIESEEICFWFANEIVVYMENLEDSTKKLLELISDYSKLQGYKINI